MNYEDELERVRAKRSRRQGAAGVSGTSGLSGIPRVSRTSGASRTSGDSGASGYDGKSDNQFISLAEPGSRASRSAGAGGNGNGSGNGGRNGNGGHGGGAGGSHNGHYYRRRKNGRNKWSTKKKVIVGVIVGLLVLIAAAVIGVYAYIQYNLGQMNDHEFRTSEVENPNISLETKEKMEEGYWTIAIFGLDSRDSSTGKGNRADVIMIVNLDRKTGEIKLASVYRDTYLNLGDDTYHKINEAYAKGGPEQAVKALNQNLDLNITNYAAFNWAAVATAINILGGVDIDISKAEFYYINAFITETVKGTGIGSVQLKSAGLNHLDGVQAVAYGRLRLMDSDYARVERQRLVIEKAFEKAKSADLMTLESLVAHMVQMCATNIEFGDIFPLAKNMSKYHLGETLGFPSARGDQRIKIGSSRLACIIPQTLVSNVSTLHEFLFGEEDYEPSSAVRSISAHISEVSGMYKEGTEATKAATDQGYIPKATEAAETEAPEELEQSSEGESTSEGESGESLGAEDGSESTAEGGTRYPGETLYPGQTLAPGETLAPGQTLTPGETLYPGQTRPGTRPGESESARYPGDTGQTSGASETTGSRRPGSPADIVPTTEAPYGPGFESQSSPVQEATTAASPGTQPTTGSSSSIIVVDPPAGSSSGPARETTAASPGPASAGGSAAGNSPSGNGTSTGNGPSSQPVPVQPGTTGGPGTALQNP